MFLNICVLPVPNLLDTGTHLIWLANIVAQHFELDIAMYCYMTDVGKVYYFQQL